MSDKSLVVNAQSWHARRFYASAGKMQMTNLCHYFWVVAKSLIAGVFTASFVKAAGRAVLKLGLWVCFGIAGAVGIVFAGGICLMLLSMLVAPVLAFVAVLSDSGPTMHNTLPLFVVFDARPHDQSSDSWMPYFSLVWGLAVYSVAIIYAIVSYNKTHQAGFIRLSWERFKVWKDGSVLCPIIEFEESQ